MSVDSSLVRQRVAEALSRAGLSDQAVAAEVLLMLPGDFLDGYEELFLRVWGSTGLTAVRGGDPDGVVAPKATQWRTSSSQAETRGAASPKGRGSTSKGLGVRDLRASATKEWADRKLRKLARDMRLRLSDEESRVRRCTGRQCRKLAEDTWNWCPFCGAATEDVQQ